jgi:sRNA-binding protein
MNPSYRKIDTDFINRGDLQGDKKELTDAEWVIQQKKNIKDQKKRETKAKRENAKRQAKEDKAEKEREAKNEQEREEHTCPTCGHDDRGDPEPMSDDPYDDQGYNVS